MEAKFVTFSIVVQETLWFKQCLDHLGANANTIDLVFVNCDSQTTITYTKGLKYHCKTKHIDTKYNFVKTWLHVKKWT